MQARVPNQHPRKPTRSRGRSRRGISIAFSTIVAALAALAWMAQPAFAQDELTEPGDGGSGDSGLTDRADGDGNGDGDSGSSADSGSSDSGSDSGSGDTDSGDAGESGPTGPTVHGSQHKHTDPELKATGFAYFGWVIDFNNDDLANNFFVSRAFLALDAVIDDQFSARIGVEMSDPLDSFGTGLVNSFFVKDLYLAVRNVFFENTLIRFGLHPAIWLELEESWWSFRFVSRSIAEQQNIVQPNDFGLSFSATILEDQLYFKVGIFNGGGAAGSQQGLFDDVEGTITDDYKTPGVEVAYMNEELAGLIVAGAWILNGGPASTFDGRGSRIFVGAKIGRLDYEGWQAALSAYLAIDFNAGLNPGDALGLSVWGAFSFELFGADLRDFGLMVRLDFYDPNNNANTADFELNGWLGSYWIPSSVIRIFLGYRKTWNLDTATNVEDVVGVWSEFHF